MHNFSDLFDKVLYMFRTVHCPSSGVSQNCIRAIRICHASSVGVCYRDHASRRQQNQPCSYVCVCVTLADANRTSLALMCVCVTLADANRTSLALMCVCVTFVVKPVVGMKTRTMCMYIHTIQYQCAATFAQLPWKHEECVWMYSVLYFRSGVPSQRGNPTNVCMYLFIYL